MRIAPEITGKGAARLMVSTDARSRTANPEDFTIVTPCTLPSLAIRNWTSAVPSIPPRRACAGYRFARSIRWRKRWNQAVPPHPDRSPLPRANPAPTPLPWRAAATPTPRDSPTPASAPGITPGPIPPARPLRSPGDSSRSRVEPRPVPRSSTALLPPACPLSSEDNPERDLPPPADSNLSEGGDIPLGTAGARRDGAETTRWCCSIGFRTLFGARFGEEISAPAADLSGVGGPSMPFLL